jgi:UDP-N-acetyl-D-galactosamine dehydrogenase
MTTIAVIGLGYVGLPLALEFGAHFFTIGYDISTSKIEAYFNNQDPSGEVGYEQFSRAIYFTPTNNIENIKIADFIIIAMPTPVDENNIPDFECLVSASQLVGANMKKGCTVIYESTVYPGATEEICIPVLEQFSNMTWLTDFNVGYSP